MSRSAEAWAWAAGLFDGEGTVYLWRHKKFQALRISVAQSNTEVLLRFRRIVGYGTVRGPYFYRNKPGRKGAFMYASGGHEAALVIGSLWPWLSQTKRRQTRTVLRAIRKFHGGKRKGDPQLVRA